MQDTKLQKQPNVRVGAEELLEDFFGLNIRSLVSIRQLFVAPRTYFNAARTPDWENNRYTPAPRLWLGLTAIMVATRFIWGDSDSPFMRSVADSMQTGFYRGAGDKEISINADWQDIMARIFDVVLLIQPFILIALMMALAGIVRFWDGPTTFTVRLRYLFAVIVPATAINLLMTFAMVFASPSLMPAISIASMATLLIFYGLTAYRGVYIDQPKDAGMPKAIVLTLIVFTVVITANLIAQMIGAVIVIIPEIREAMQSARDAAGS